ncbi:putative transcriptional regulatory protein [Colletotrichum tropicale]|nr:putative transcriptional regulatory protein [Colletotrichum tropicale]
MADLNIQLSTYPESNAVPFTNTPQASKPKHSRTSTRKVRTGCITCKKRHVKCDEGKPHCSNCLQNRGYCEGYALEPRKNAAAKPGQVVWDSRQAVRHAAHPRIQLKLDPDALDFTDTSSMRYFEEFVNLAKAPWTNAAASSSLWEVTLPQLARNSSTLRSAAMAIGALSVWHRQSAQRSLRTISVPEMSINESDEHYFNAVAHYCHSIKEQSRQASLQDAVILSVLLLLFETLRDNRKAALDHVNHGLCLMLSLVTDENAEHHIRKLAPNPKPLLAAIADVFNHLAKQARTVLRDRVGQGPPLPNLTKVLRSRNHTMESFMILLSQVPSSDVDIDDIPTVFKSLDDFEDSWNAVQRAQTAMIPIMVEYLYNSDVIHSHDEEVIYGFHVNLLQNPRILEFSEKSNKTMEALDAGFQPLFNKIIMSHDADSPLYLRAIHLRLQHLGVYTFDNPPMYVNIDLVKARTPLFREYLSVASIALRAAKRDVEKNPAHQVSLQCNITWHLMVLSFFCRDPLARDEAVEMLKDYPGQDGLWKTRALYAIAARNRTIECMNASEGTPEEQWRRFWRREFLFEEGGDRVLLRYLEKDGLLGTWTLVQEAAVVRGKDEDIVWTRQPVHGRGGLLMAEVFGAERAEFGKRSGQGTDV